MKVKLAVETLSTSVTNAIDFCAIDLNLEKIHDSATTSLFIRNMNNIFDLLNSRRHRKKKNIEKYEKYVEYLQNIYIDEQKKLYIQKNWISRHVSLFIMCKRFIGCIKCYRKK